MPDLLVLFAGLANGDEWPDPDSPILQLVIYVEGFRAAINALYQGHISDSAVMFNAGMKQAAINAARAAGHVLLPADRVVVLQTITDSTVGSA